MSALEKAHLEVLDKKGKVTESIKVQFNPSTMTVQMSNSNDGGKSRGRQTQQYNGSASTTLSLDLEFDTADEGTDARPVDVRTRTAKVAQFVLPGGKASKQAPPRVKFRWGTFELIGVMNSLTEELSLFSMSGVPLRAKVTVQIKQQDPKFDALERGPGANTDSNPPAAGAGDAGGAGGPGTSGGGLADAAAPALAGETPADFLARNGLAPEAWRALGGALDALANGIELEAGLSVEFASSLSVGGGIGVSAGFQAALDVGIGASLGLEGGSAAGRDAGLQQGFALSSAGGATAAVETAKASTAAEAADAARDELRAAGAGDRRSVGHQRRWPDGAPATRRRHDQSDAAGHDGTTGTAPTSGGSASDVLWAGCPLARPGVGAGRAARWLRGHRLDLVDRRIGAVPAARSWSPVGAARPERHPHRRRPGAARPSAELRVPPMRSARTEGPLMTVHVGEITSEVNATGSGASDDASGERDEWEERARLAASFERIERDRCRTATGYGDD